MAFDIKRRKTKRRVRKGAITTVHLDDETDAIWKAMVKKGLNMSAFVQEQVKYHHSDALAPWQREERMLEELRALQARRQKAIEAVIAEFDPLICRKAEELEALREHNRALEAGQ